MSDDACTCYVVQGVVIRCMNCTLERISVQGSDPRLLDAFDHHAKRMLDRETDEHVRAHAKGRLLMPPRLALVVERESRAGSDFLDTESR